MARHQNLSKWSSDLKKTITNFNGTKGGKLMQTSGWEQKQLKQLVRAVEDSSKTMAKHKRKVQHGWADVFMFRVDAKQQTAIQNIPIIINRNWILGRKIDATEITL